MRASETPRRIRRCRKLRVTPEGAEYVGRGSLYANPFSARRWGHARAVRLHREWLHGTLGQRRLLRMGYCPAEIDALRRLRLRVLRSLDRLIGKNIQCWCAERSRFCHGDNLIELAAQAAARELRR